MAKTQPPDTETKTTDASMMTGLMEQWQRAGLSSLNWMGAYWAEGMADMSSEWLSFLSKRVAEDVKFQHAVLHTKSPTELHQLQADFIQTAIDQYAAETGKMIELSAKLFERPDNKG